MKTVTLFFFIVFGMTLTANAQITKGNWLVGGDAFYSSTTSKYQANEDVEAGTDRFNEIRINPNIGYFFIDKLAGGLQVNLSFTDNNPGVSNNRDGRNHGYGLSPFMRYYFLDEDKQINVFVQANYSVSFGEKFQKDNDIDASGYGLQAGTVLFFNQSIGLEFSLKYTRTTRQSNDLITNKLLVGLGFQIHLEK